MTTAAMLENVPFVDLPDDRTRMRGLGSLRCAVEGAPPVELPLASVDIRARVAERVAEVVLLQTFRNPHKEHLEATYIFPLAGSSAVSAFEMRVGGRVIDGVVQERGAARRAYQRALEEGRRAALMEQERDDVFTVQVGNLPPGEEITVRIVCSERLPYFDDGRTELRLPLVVAPRYVPGSPLDRPPVGAGTELDTDLVPDASRISPPRLVEGFDPKVALSLAVELLDIDGQGLSDLSCSQHATRTSLGGGGVTVSLARTDEPLDRDFVLRWRAAGARLRSTLLVHADARGSRYGLLSIVPPAQEGFLGLARDVVFVVDRSGSMEGAKMASAARACSVLLRTLGPRDRFAIQAFDDRVEWMPTQPSAHGRFVIADEGGVARGDKYLRAIGARGGTELDGAIGEAISALDARAESVARAAVIVLLTDGQIGDESRVLGRIQRALGDARVFTVGIDTAVNDGFLVRLAALGGGTSAFVTPGEALEEALQSVGREIGNPLVTGLAIDDVSCDLDRSATAPARLADLFPGRATWAFVRLGRAGALRVRGRFADGKPLDERVDAKEISLPAIAHLWARARVADLEDRFRLDPAAGEKTKKEIVELSVEHTLLTRFTAFVAVDRAEIVNAGGQRRQVVQPVEMPARWEMDAQAPGSMPPPMLEAAAMPMLSGMSLPTPPAPAPSAPAGPPQPRLGRMQKMATASAPPPEAPRPPAPRAKKSVVRGAAQAIKERITDLLMGEEEPATRETSAAAAASEAEAPGAESIVRAIEKMALAIAAARTDIEAGRVPDVKALEAARRALLAALSGSELGQRTPRLQRFLRSAAVELVAALQTPGVTAAALQPLFARHAQAFEAARRAEEVAITDGGRGGRGGNFWEKSI